MDQIVTKLILNMAATNVRVSMFDSITLHLIP